MEQRGIFLGRTDVRYPFSRFGWTRGGGKTWHGGIDLVGLDDTVIRMPYWQGRPIIGTVTRARIVTDKSNRTWEWGWYLCIRLDYAQTSDAVNYLYFCHCRQLLVQQGDRVISGQKLAIMGQTGNAAGGYDHCHLEVRAKAGGVGIDPTAYAGCPNVVGIYGEGPAGQLQLLTVGPASAGDVKAVEELCRSLNLKVEKGVYNATA